MTCSIGSCAIYETRRGAKKADEASYVNITYNPNDCDSDYLCKECGGLLYVSWMTAHDICVNQDCIRFPHEMQFYELSKIGSPQLHRELDASHAELLSNISRCDHAQLALYIYEKRKNLIALALNTGVMPSIPDFFALNELLITLNNKMAPGIERDDIHFESIFRQARKLTEELNHIDDLNERRYLWIKGPGNPQMLIMKYLNVIRDVQKSYGLTSSSSVKDMSDLFKFKDIQELVTKEVELVPGVDHADFLDSLWPYVLTLRYAFSMNYRTAKQYNYECDATDVAALLSYFLSIRNDDTLIVTISNVNRHYTNQPQTSKSFQGFLSEYVCSQDKVPIMVKVGDRIIVDRLTLLFFIVYLHGHYEVSGSKRTGRGARIHRKKEETGKIFEYQLNTQISEQGYKGPDKPVQIKNFEYDIIKISEGNKRIILIDAKFRDPAPSSISGHTIIEQEILDPRQGLLVESERQLNRLQFFNHNKEIFREYLNPEADWQEYDIKAYVITKHVPLIRRYKDIRIMSASDFLKSEL